MDNKASKLTVGITSCSSEWITLLRQEGVPWEQVPIDERPSPDEYAAVIVPERVAAPVLEGISSYVKEGGSIVVGNVPKDDLRGSCLVPVNDGAGRIGKGFALFLGDPFPKRRKASRKYFDARSGLPSEIVAGQSWSASRRLAIDALKRVFAARSLPFIRKSYYPQTYNCVFSFRVDVDGFEPNDFNSLLKTSLPFKDRMSWFICCRDFSKNREGLKELINQGFDVQSHGFDHIPFTGEKWSMINLERAHKFLSKAGAVPQGFVGPAGAHGRGLQRALERLGYLYSSEFALDYDNIPFYPAMDSISSTVLQVPIHPICLGSFLATTDIKADDPAILNYFDSVIARKFALGEPILLYGHPTGELGARPRILLEIMERVDALKGVWKTTMTAFAKWWAERDRIRFCAKVDSKDPSKLFIGPERGSFAGPFPVEIYNAPGKRSRVLVEGEGAWIDLGGLQFEDIGNEPSPGNTGNPVRPSFYLTYSYLRRRYIEKVLWGISRADWLKRAIRLALEAR